MKVEVPAGAEEAFADVVKKLREHQKRRPHEIRSMHESLGLVSEEFFELTKGVSKTDLHDPLDAVLNDLCELATISISSYVDLSKAARARSTTRPAVRSMVPLDKSFIRGGYNQW